MSGQRATNFLTEDVMKLKPQKDRQFLILKCGYVTWKEAIEDFHYRTMLVIFKPYFESQICELRIFFYAETCRSIAIA